MMAEREKTMMLNFEDELTGRCIRFEVPETIEIYMLWDALKERAFYPKQYHCGIFRELGDISLFARIKDTSVKDGDVLHIVPGSAANNEPEYYVDNEGHLHFGGAPGYEDSVTVRGVTLYGCPRAAEVSGIDTAAGCNVEIVAYE